jgi:predicted glycosyltransferase
MRKPIRIWYDFTNVPHVHFLKPIMMRLRKLEVKEIVTLRDFLETEQLFKEQIGGPYLSVGGHGGKSKINKLAKMTHRVFELNKLLPSFDFKVSIGGDSSEIVSLLRKKPSITFDDNELAPNWLYGRFTYFSFWTDAVDEQTLIGQGFRKDRLYRYPGYKEDIYVADYEPDSGFMDNIPFSNYVLLRSENIAANYVKDKNDYIFPSILKACIDRGMNVVVLPRNPIDKEIAKTFNNVYVPERAVNGLDACYYADAVITGAGTLAREAACMGVPAISFFTGNKLMAVDRKMIKEGMLFHSRNTEEIIDQVVKSKRKDADFSRSKAVQKEVIDKLISVIEGF